MQLHSYPHLRKPTVAATRILVRLGHFLCKCSFVASDPDYQKIAKLARDTDAAPPPKLSLAVSEVIRTIRAANGLSQKDLAAKINEKQSVLQDYESGKAIPNTQILGKLERILGVKLRGEQL